MRSRISSDQPAAGGARWVMAQMKPANSRAIAAVTTLAGSARRACRHGHLPVHARCGTNCAPSAKTIGTTTRRYPGGLAAHRDCRCQWRCGDFIAAPARRCGLTNVGPGHIPAHNGQRYALTRGGVRCMSQNLTPATTATMIAVTTWTRVAVAWTANQTAHADTATQTPSKRLIHSSHSANANSAASATTPIATPLSQAFQLAAVLGTKPKIHGVRNSQAPKTRLITSAIVSLFFSCSFSDCSFGRPPLAFAAISAESPS